MASLSSILAWEIPWTKEPDELQSMGLQRVRRDLATKQQQQSNCYFCPLDGLLLRMHVGTGKLSIMPILFVKQVLLSYYSFGF